VAYVRDYLLDRDIDPTPLFRDCDIPWHDGDELTPVPVPRVAQLLEMAAEVSENSCMGMDMGQFYHYEASSILIMAMLAAPRVEEGLKCLNRYDKYVDTGIATDFNLDKPVAEFGARVICDDNITINQLNEYLMVFLAHTLDVATRSKLPVEEAWFTHGNDQNAAALEEYFGARVKFGQDSNKLYFDRGYLNKRFYSSNSLLYEILTNAMKTYFSPAGDRRGFIDQVSREIISCPEGDPDSAEHIAQRLAISPRTLRRRLAEEGYTFQAAKNLARERQAKYLLSHTTLPLSEIAFKLGYSELSAFSRAFRAWANVTPQNYRERSRKLMRA
jgi:AraC-like DNA-binding protein